jgi:hypothetical protein
MLNTENAMWVRGRWLSYVVVMLVVPLCCEAQGRGPRSGGRDSILNGAAIGIAAGAGFGIAYVSVVRDSDLDVGDYASSALIFGGLGAAVGLGIDALCDRNSGAIGPRRVALRPRLSRKAAAIRVIMRW